VVIGSQGGPKIGVFPVWKVGPIEWNLNRDAGKPANVARVKNRDGGDGFRVYCWVDFGIRSGRGDHDIFHHAEILHRPIPLPQYDNPHLGVLRNERAGLRIISMKTPKTLSHGSTFGPFSRYMLVRHESHRGPEFSMWFVLDAERVDEVTGGPAVIRQEATIDAAVAGLPVAVTFGGVDGFEELGDSLVEEICGPAAGVSL
jgi:hypothetical protein